MSAATPIPVLALDTIDSTNSEAMRRITAGHRSALWITARRQTAGKGRSGRAWTSETGNLYASLILPVAASPAVAYQLSLVAGIATVDAVLALAGGAVPGLRLKWPNDVLLDGGKLAGILAESTTPPAHAGFMAVIGVGLNVAAPPDDTGRPVACLAAKGIAATPERTLTELSAWMSRRLAVWSAGMGFDRIRDLWLERAGPAGELLSVNAGNGPVAGRFVGLDAHGALLIRLADGGVRTFTFGDVTLPATSAPAHRA